MAITNADGSIILTTKVDTSGLNKGLKSLTGTASKLGGVLASIFSLTALYNFSKEASNIAVEQEANVQRLIDIYGQASNVVGDFIDQNARALGMSKQAATGFSAVYGNLFSVWADQATNAELTNRYLQMTAVIASKTGRTVTDVQERVRSGLLGNTEAIEDLGVFVNVKTIEMTEAFQRIADGRSWEKLSAYEQQQVRTLAILEQSTLKYGNQVSNTTTIVRARYLASYQEMQATWGQFVNVVLVPVLQVVTQIMDVITAGMRAIAGLTGKTLAGANSVSSSIGSSVDNQNDLTKAVKGTNKELKKSLAGFDELNTLSQDTASGAGGGVGSGAGIGDLGIGDLGGTLDGSAYVSEIKDTLLQIMAVVGMALVAVGLILIATGHLGWGVGFIIAGAGVFAVTMATLKDSEISQKVKDSLTNVVIIAGLVAIALGILICATGHWGLGVGMIVLGASSVAASVSLNWKGIKQQLKGTFGTVLAVVGLVAIALGVIACIGGAWAIGIGLIITGATAFGTAVAFNWNGIKEALKGRLGTAITIAGIVAIVFGVLACFAQQWALGIGLIVTGALSLGVTATVNWNSIKQALQGPLGKAIAVVGVVAIIIGVLICCTGNFPLGLGLIVAGGLSIASVVTVNWNTIVNKIKTVWTSVKDYWKKNIAKYFTSSWWSNLAKTGINALLRTVVNGLNRLIDRLNRFGFRVPEVLGGGWVGFNVSRLSVPQLAKGAVLPPNKPFLAMVGDQKNGTNIEAPLDTIKQGVAEVLADMRFSGNSAQTIIIPVTVNGREILRVVREAENDAGSQVVYGGFANAY